MPHEDLLDIAFNIKDTTYRALAIEKYFGHLATHGDVVFAFTEFEKLGPGSLRTNALKAYVLSTPRDGSSLSQLAKEVSNLDLPEDKKAALHMLSSVFWDLDLDGIKRVLNDGQSGEVRNILASNYAARLPSRGGSARDAIAELQSQFTGSERENALNSYWLALTNSETEKTLEALDRGIIDPSIHSDIVKLATANMLRKDSTEGIDWLNSQENSNLIEDAAFLAFGDWVHLDSVAAADNVEKLTNTSAKRGAARAIANRMRQLGDKDSAKEWDAFAKTIGQN